MFQQNSNLYQLIILLEHKIIETHVGKTTMYVHILEWLPVPKRIIKTNVPRASNYARHSNIAGPDRITMNTDAIVDTDL